MDFATKQLLESLYHQLDDLRQQEYRWRTRANSRIDRESKASARKELDAISARLESVRGDIKAIIPKPFKTVRKFIMRNPLTGKWDTKVRRVTVTHRYSHQDRDVVTSTSLGIHYTTQYHKYLRRLGIAQQDLGKYW